MEIIDHRIQDKQVTTYSINQELRLAYLKVDFKDISKTFKQKFTFFVSPTNYYLYGMFLIESTNNPDYLNNRELTYYGAKVMPANGCGDFQIVIAEEQACFVTDLEA